MGNSLISCLRHDGEDSIWSGRSCLPAGDAVGLVGQLGGDMAEDSTEFKPTREQATADILRLGQLLHLYAFPQSDLGLTRPIRPHEASMLRSEIEAIEKRIETAVYDTNQRLLRSLLDIRGDQVLGDHIALRIIAYVAWSSLTTERSGASLARVATAVSMGDIAGHVEARKTIRMLVCKRDAICYKESDYSGGELLPAWKLSKFLSNDQIPILWDEESLQKDRDEWERKKIAESHKPASSPRHAEPPPSAPKPNESLNLLTARGIFNLLKDEVIAIDAPLLRFSAQMSLHMRRLEQIRKGIRPSVGPIVTMLVGNSGSGKTWMAENFAKVSGLPYAISDMSGVSQASYVGLSIDECFYPLLANKTKIADAQTGLVVWDEFDKLSFKGGGHSTADPQGRGIQAELLKPLDGCKLPLGSRRSNSPYFGVLDTYHTCFVLAGAFDGLRDLLADSNRKSSGLGFGSAGAKNTRGDIREALVRYGFMEQIINRIGAIIVLPDPTPDQIVRITSHPGTGLLARWNSFANSFGMSIDITEEAIQYLANWACETKGYSRAVKTILGSLVEGHLYDDKPGEINVWLADVKKAIHETESSEHLGL